MSIEHFLFSIGGWEEWGRETRPELADGDVRATGRASGEEREGD